MKIAIPQRCIDQAKDYAKKSFGYTYNHPGWESEKSKANRILFGKVAELTIIDFLKINEVDITEDKTSEKENDDFDFLFKLRKYDVKTTYTRAKYCCITETYEKKLIDYFIATRIDFELRFVEVFGVVRKNQALDTTYFINPGENLPDSNYTCSFEHGAYFYTGPYEDILSHFELNEAEKTLDYWRRLALSKINVA